MEKNIVMQIIKDSDPKEARFRKDDFIIGQKNTISNLMFDDQVFSEKKYQLKEVTIKDLEESQDVKYHYFKYCGIHLFSFLTITKEEALKRLNNKKRIAIKHHDTRILEHILSDDEQIHFLNSVAQYESECVLNEDWLTWTKTNYKLPQINYYKDLKSDHDRQLYADALGQQYALNLLLDPISVLIDTYDLDCINTFFKDIEFYFDDNNTSENDENQYVTSLKIKELWLPAEDFNLDDDTETKIVNGTEFVEIDDAIENYSFESNRVRYDSNWYDTFLIKL